MKEDRTATLRPLLWLTALGVGVRLGLFLLAGEPELVADEANYLYSALYLNYFGSYADSYRFLWPPGYPLLLSQFIAAFGSEGLAALKLFQVFASASTGLFTMLIARELFDARASRIAGWMWCLYLPMAGYTHLLWTESLFLAVFTPALYVTLRQFTRPQSVRDGHLLLAGLAFAASAYLKEIPLYLAPLLVIAMLVQRGTLGARERLRRATLLLLALLVCVVPWTLRNASVYGRLVPIGTSMGENSTQGWNARDVNFDLAGLDEARAARGLSSMRETKRPALLDFDREGLWFRAPGIRNTADRLGEQTRRGLNWVRLHPAEFLKTRVQKLADLCAPHSFPLRHLAMGRYDDAPLGSALLRKLVMLWALLCPLLLLPLAFAGLWRIPRESRWFVWTVLLFVLATSMLVSMSRFRMPALPLLMASAAGCVSYGVRARHLLIAGIVLVPLWWLIFPSVWAVLELAWSAS